MFSGSFCRAHYDVESNTPRPMVVRYYMLTWTQLYPDINRLFANFKGDNLGVVRLFHLLNKGNQVIFIVW